MNDPSQPGLIRKVLWNATEFAIIIAIWYGFQSVISGAYLHSIWTAWIIVAVSWFKTAFFGIENLQQLLSASRQNLAYHRFMVLMFVNMTQIILSFGLDFHCLHTLQAGCFSSIPAQFSQGELVFEFIYFSSLNFTFFGYGDVTPQTIPAKLLTLTEIFLAFVTVIFLLSDFISLKESLREK